MIENVESICFRDFACGTGFRPVLTRNGRVENQCHRVLAARRSARCRGFTLIELLTVISIISLLMAILLPALSNARKRSRATKCQANLRELAIATLQYATRNDDRFPVAGDCDSSGGNCQFWNGHQYFGWNGERDRPQGGGPWYRPVNTDLGIENSTPNPEAGKIARCPDDMGAVGETGTNKPVFEVLGSSYVVNPILAQGRYAPWKYRSADLNTSDVVQVSRAILVADHIAFGLTYDAAWTAISPGWHNQVKPAAAIGFADGHAEYIQGRCGVREWQWYPDAPGPKFIMELSQKVNWQVYPGCE